MANSKADFPTREAYDHAAWLLLVEARMLRAFAKVEAGPEGAFLESGEPVILFERHKFSLFTGHRFDAAHGDISNPIPGGYGKYSEQHEKLQRAIKLDHEAALMACSWGLFQIMGFNHKEAGFPDLQRFVNAMYRSADDHLRAVTLLIRNNANLVDALRNRDFRAAAYYYNGPGYTSNRYDVKLRDAYDSDTA